MSQDLEFYVAIDPTLPKELTSPAVAFGDFETTNPGAVVYTRDGVSQLARFYVDLICGRPFPLQFIARELTLEVLVAVTLFFDRDLALNHRVPGFITEVELVSALQGAGLAHIDRDLASFLVFLDFFLCEERKSKRGVEEKMASAIEWVRDYLLHGQIPSTPVEPGPPRVIDVGTNGFVLAEAQKPKDFFWSMVDLYRMGYLRGAIFTPEGHVYGFRKSFHLRFDLEAAAGQLNQAEAAMGRPEAWRVQKGLYLHGPTDGTPIPRETLIEILLRI